MGQYIDKHIGDIGETRSFKTPSPTAMEKKLYYFVERWESASDCHGKRLFKTETDNAIKNLMKHVRNGCLSGIPPGCGTNHNEIFHQYINTFFHRSKIGIFLAYALLSVFIYHHNTKSKVHHKVVTRPIEATQFIYEPREPQCSVGILPKHRHCLTDSDMDITVQVYSTCVQKMTLLATVEKAVASLLPISQFRPFCPSIIDTIRDVQDSDENYKDIQKQLNQYGLKLQVSTDGGIGNSFFLLAKGIFQHLSTWSTALTNLGIIEYSNANLPMKLRQVFVNEHSSERSHHYRCFTTLQEDFASETSKFLLEGYYDSVIGNLMPLAMSNALHACFVIIRPKEPPLYVTPEYNICHGTIFLAYQRSGKGHYDAAISVTHPEVEIPSTPATVEVKCSCGVNCKDGTTACVSKPLYATRCRCYKLGTSCSHLCKCKNCSNPYGERKTPVAPTQRKKRS